MGPLPMQLVVPSADSIKLSSGALVYVVLICENIVYIRHYIISHYQ